MPAVLSRPGDDGANDLRPQPGAVFAEALLALPLVAVALQQRFPEVAGEQPELIAQHLTGAGEYEQAVVFWRTHEHVQDDDVGSSLEAAERFVRTPEQQARVRHAFRTCVRLLAERDKAYAAVLSLPDD